MAFLLSRIGLVRPRSEMIKIKSNRFGHGGGETRSDQTSVSFAMSYKGSKFHWRFEIGNT
jgi:hypothetical protein